MRDNKPPEDTEAINQITGLMFRFLRERAGMSEEKTAAELGVTVTALVSHENGQEPLSTAELYRAGKLFGVKISAFFAPYYYPEQFNDPAGNVFDFQP